MRVVAVRVEAKVEEADALATQVFEESLMPLVIPTVAAASISADLTHEKSRAALRDMPKEPLPRCGHVRRKVGGRMLRRSSTRPEEK